MGLKPGQEPAARSGQLESSVRIPQNKGKSTFASTGLLGVGERETEQLGRFLAPRTRYIICGALVQKLLRLSRHWQQNSKQIERTF